MTPPKTVSPSEAGRLLGVGRQRVHQLRADGSLEAEQVDGLWRIRLSSVKSLKRRRDSGEVQAWRKRAS